LLAFLARKCDISRFSNFFHLSDQCVYNALSIREEKNELFLKHYADHTKVKVSTESLNDLKYFFETNSKIVFKHDKESGVRVTSSSSTELFSIFLSSQHSSSIGIKVFMRVQKELRIYKSKHKLADLFSCHKCLKLGDLLLELNDSKYQKIENIGKKMVLETKVNKILFHKKLASTQWQAFHTHLDSLVENYSCLVLQDFGKQFTQSGKVCVHVMVLFYKLDNRLKPTRTTLYLRYFDEFSGVIIY